MHICHINLSREFRGGERQTLALVEALCELAPSAGISQSLVVRKDSRMQSRCAGIQGVSLRAVQPTLLHAAAAARDADIIQIHEGRSTKVGALLSLKGTPFVVTRRIPNSPKSFFLTRWVYSRAAHIACVSTAVADVMRAYAGSSNISTIYDCARPLRVPTDSQVRKNPNKLTVAAVGEIDFSHKGHDLLVDVARNLAAQGVDVDVLVAGTGKDRDELFARTRDLTNFRLLGWVDDVMSVLARADVLVHPARKEGLGSVMLEAMTVGVPVIATRVGGIPEVVTHEHDGLLVEPDSSSAIQEAVARLATDSHLRAKLGRNAALSVARFSPQAMAQSYLNVYLHVVAQTGLRSRMQ